MTARESSSPQDEVVITKWPFSGSWMCSAPYAYIGPYAYGTSHMRILIWDAHTRMGQHFVPYEYFICMFYFFTGLWIPLLKIDITVPINPL